MTVSPERTVRYRLAVAWAGLGWERLSAGLWRAATLVIFGAAFALLDILPSLPGTMHVAVLLVFVAAVVALAAKGLRGFAWPHREEARARLEARSPVVHRPLTATEDSLPASATPLQQAMWKRHQELARAALAKLRSPWPLSEVARRDGFAVRALAVLCLAVAWIGTGRDADDRIVRAIAPSFGDSNVPVTVKLWITPPTYTNQSPTFIDNPTRKAATVDVPAGSKAMVLVTGTRRKTDLVVVDAQRKSQKLPLRPSAGTDDGSRADASQRVETTLEQPARLEVRQGPRVLARWTVNWIADKPPQIALASEPRDAGRGRLLIDYVAVDDYGLQSVTGKITREGSEETIEFPLSMPPFSPLEAKQTSLHDLGGSPWAGMEVTLTVSATDQADQTTTAEAVKVTIPQRDFNHPVARQIAHWRKRLMTDPNTEAPPARAAFSRLMNAPADFGNDTVVYLALSTAKARLMHQDPPDAMRGLPELLWQTAVRVEDGALGEAETRLEAAQRALRQAMEKGGTNDEISKALSDLQQAYRDFSRALAEKMQRNEKELGGLDKDGNIVTSEDIADAMNKLKELTKIGAKDEAREMMAELDKMLETMRNAASGEASQNAEMEELQKLLEQMQQLTEDQSELLDETFDEARKEAEAQQAKAEQARADEKKTPEEKKAEQAKAEKEREKEQAKAEENAKKAAEKQEKLRQELMELSKGMTNMSGKQGGALSTAQGAMRDAVNALKAQSWKAGAEAQGSALANMEDGMRESAEDMMKNMAKQGFSGLVQMPGSSRRLGSAFRGTENKEHLDLPSGADTQGMAARVRVILEEIRRRAEDRTRPAAEQEYLRRLMKEF